MNCQRYLSGEIVSASHFQECGECAARRAREQQLAAGLQMLGAQMRRVEAPPRVERSLAAAFRGQKVPGGSRGRGSWWMVGSWAAALAATAALAVTLTRPHVPEQTHRRVRSLTQLASVEMQGAAPVETEGSGGEFLPLPNAEAVGPSEEMNLVRVELPRSAMISMGFTVPEERASETVQADVMLDGDGVARAVRFVDSERSGRELTW